MRHVIAAVAALVMSGPVMAGEQYVDGSGYAASGFDVVAFFDAAAKGGASGPVPGSTAFTASWNGATWAFASAENRDRFAADPAAFAPQFDGHCAYGVASGYKVPGDPQVWSVVDGRLYLNYDRSVGLLWNKDAAGFIATAQSKWPGLDATPASDEAVPELKPGIAPARG